MTTSVEFIHSHDINHYLELNIDNDKANKITIFSLHDICLTILQEHTEIENNVEEFIIF